MLFGYFYWDPDRAMFHFDLPFLGRPILWYGFLFAFGFFVAYWILVYLLRRYFLYHSEVFIADIVRWPDLLLKLKKRDEGKEVFRYFFSYCSADVQDQIKQYQRGDLLPKRLKEGIVSAINAFLKDPTQHDRLLKKRWGQKMLGPVHQIQLSHRLLVEAAMTPILKTLNQRAKAIAEKLTLYVIIGTLVGARLGDLFFYQDWRWLIDDPFSFFRIWEGGLASHGGAVGILIALILFSRTIRRSYPIFSFLRIFDFVVIPTSFAAICIRIGNFVNQEILGKETRVPWAVIFGDPADGSEIVPRHPVQLYEALSYGIIFLVLFFYWGRKPFLSKEGRVSGLFLILVFGTRFILECFKEEQSVYLSDAALLSMGQILSIPFLILGFWFFYRRQN